VNSSGWVGIPGLYHESISTIDDLLGVVTLGERRRMRRRRERGEEGLGSREWMAVTKRR
jgi:hypothetical protein